MRLSHSERSRRIQHMLMGLAMLFLLSITLSAKEPQVELFHTANLSYKEKDYTKAIALYDSVVNMGYISADLFFNLGNAHFKMGRLAPAILNYERANKLDPGNEDIEFNLKIANLRVADRIEPVPELFFVRWTKDFVIRQSSDGWAKLGIGCIWLAFIFGAAVVFVNNIAVKRLGFLFGIVALVASIIFGILSYSQYKYQQNNQGAIVFVTNAYIKSAPDAESADLFILREGVKVDLLESEGDWHRIKLADGKVGWIAKEQVVAI